MDNSVSRLTCRTADRIRMGQRETTKVAHHLEEDNLGQYVACKEFHGLTTRCLVFDNNRTSVASAKRGICSIPVERKSNAHENRASFLRVHWRGKNWGAS